MYLANDKADLNIFPQNKTHTQNKTLKFFSLGACSIVFFLFESWPI